MTPLLACLQPIHAGVARNEAPSLITGFLVLAARRTPVFSIIHTSDLGHHIDIHEGMPELVSASESLVHGLKENEL